MKRLYTILALMLCLTLSVSAAPASKGKRPAAFNAGDFGLQLPANAPQWRSQKSALSPFSRRQSASNAFNCKMKAPITEGDTKIGPTNSFGTLYAPDGTEWLYTAKFDFNNAYNYTAAHLTIYDAQHNIVGTIDDTFKLGEHETGVNSVMIDPNITQKFFNVDDKYELILFIHATTDDYTGATYQHIFTLAKDQTEPLMTIPGNEILIADMATDQWSEKKQMIMMREEFTQDDKYLIHFDVYDRAGWGSTKAPVLLHTFSTEYKYISGSGGNAQPICVKNINGKAHYALSRYEKPYFDEDTPIYEEPVVNPDNKFIIDLYSSDDFTKPYKSIVMPMTLEEGYLYTFPSLGSFMGNDDFSLGLFGDKETPYFLITYDNYVTASDDFESAVYLYNQDGERVKTLFTAASDYMHLSDIPGEDPLFCVIDMNAQTFNFIEMPSCSKKAVLSFTLDERNLSSSLDRIPANGSYSIVIAGAQGEVDAQQDILHPIAYINPDGSLNRWEMVNLGPDVVMAQPAIIGSWLNPYLFDTDDDMDYLFLVKLPQDPSGQSTAADEHLWLLNAEGEKHADFGPSETEGDLSTILLLNTENNYANLCTTYYRWDTSVFTLNLNKLPLSRFTAGGKGTADDPYLVSTTGDLLQIQSLPTAHYRLANNINCRQHPFGENKTQFSGSFDGNGNIIHNLSLNGGSLFGEILGKANIHDLYIEDVKIKPQGTQFGVIGTTARYDGESAPTLSNIHIINPSAEDDEYDGAFGTIIGQLTTGSTLTASSVTKADISLPEATVGGLVGDINASGANISAAHFSGSLYGKLAGGVIATIAKGNISNVHVNGDIFAQEAAGSVVAETGDYDNKRCLISQAYAEGTVVSSNEKDPSVGGIAGRVTLAEGICLENNVCALSVIDFPENAEKQTAHRIAGHTNADELGEILWEDPWWDEFIKEGGDPYEHKELWPRGPVAPDKGFANNYALLPLQPVNGDEQMAADKTSVEGQSVNPDDYADFQAFFTDRQFLFGETAEQPWKWVNNRPALWFEDTLPSEINTVEADPQTDIALRGGRLSASGGIAIYSISGKQAATALGTFDTRALQPGVYVAKSGSQAIKFVVK